MSEENVETMRRIYAEQVSHPEAVRELYEPDYEMDLTDAAPDIGVVRGFDAVEEALRPYWEMFDDFRYEIEEVIHADERQVVIAARDGGRMRGSNSEVWNRFFHVWTFRAGKVIRHSAHLDRNRALKAAGMRE
jgi:ketosteroid isomerase-like protein